MTWEKISATECRLVALPPKPAAPDPIAAIAFAREHGLEEGLTDAYLADLRDGDHEFLTGGSGWW